MTDPEMSPDWETIIDDGDLPRVFKPEGGRPIKSWATSVEPGAVEQAINLARLPFALSHVALMPDAHQGYGMPIGGVLFADAAVVPYAIGVDIGCGVILAESDLGRSDLTAERLTAIGNQILRDVPVGLPPGGNRSTPMDGLALLDDMDYAALPDSIQADWWVGALRQIGTLGGGNHFIELLVDDDDRVYVMLHSGSRGLGKKICDYYVVAALAENMRWYSALPHRDLAYLPWGTPLAAAYWEAMLFAMHFAEINRVHMLGAVGAVISGVLGHDQVRVPKIVVDCHHNYAAWENHGGWNGIVHRKGAVRARNGENVLIPGSMGTASYWGRGKGNPQSFQTCQHGAGRAMSRGAARKLYEVATMTAELEAAETQVFTPKIADVLDEAPRAYKDIEAVMADSTDLVEVVKRLRPIATVKG